MLKFSKVRYDLSPLAADVGLGPWIIHYLLLARVLLCEFSVKSFIYLATRARYVQYVLPSLKANIHFYAIGMSTLMRLILEAIMCYAQQQSAPRAGVKKHILLFLRNKTEFTWATFPHALQN